MAADWSSLPSDIVIDIATKLDTFEDCIYFSAVCTCWYQASVSIRSDWKRSLRVPWLLLAETKQENPDCIRKVFNPTNGKCYRLNLPETFGKRCFGSAYGWIAMVDPDFNVQLFHPITKAQLHFPSLRTLPNSPVYNMHRDKTRKHFLNRCLNAFVQKCIVLKMQHEFVIAVIYDDPHGLAFARHDDQSWTFVAKKTQVSQEPLEADSWIYDVASMDDYINALYRSGSIICWDIKESRNLELVEPLEYSPADYHAFKDINLGKIYLVKSGRDILKVLRYQDDVWNDSRVVYRTIHFDVYKLDLNDKRWKNIDDLGDVALFLGDNSSLSVPVAENLQRNCIYFTDDNHESFHRVKRHGGHDMGVFDLSTGNFSDFYEGGDTRSLVCPPIWFVPDF